jgi:hypothetical protein
MRKCCDCESDAKVMRKCCESVAKVLREGLREGLELRKCCESVQEIRPKRQAFIPPNKVEGTAQIESGEIPDELCGGNTSLPPLTPLRHV